MKKREFIKELRKEKNEILRNRRIIYILFILAIVYLISTYYIISDKSPVKVSMSLYWTQWAWYAITIIPSCIVDIDTDNKIKKMFEEYKKGNKDYKNTQKPISKKMIILALIVGLIGLIELSDFTYSIITGNKPIISVEEKVENERYSGKHKTLLYNYYKCGDGEVYLRLKKEGFKKGYAEKVSIEEYIKKINNNLKLANIDKEIKFDEKIYNNENCYTWIIEEKIELEITLDDIEDEMKDENSLGNVKWVYLIYSDENYDKNKFEEYSKVLIKTDFEWYTEEQIENIYYNATLDEHEEDNIFYELDQSNDNLSVFQTYRMFEDYYNM